jgi:hypothetical protein
LQVHAERDRGDIRRADAFELLARETRCADHGVIVGRGAGVGEVGELPRGSVRKDLTHKAIEALMGDHHRRDAVFAAPRAQ